MTEPTPVTKAAMVRHAAEFLFESSTPGDVRVARALQEMHDTGASFEAAFGLAPGWRKHDAKSCRDGALRQIAREYFSELDGRPLCRAILAAQRAYLARFKGDQQRGTRPEGLNGLIFDVMQKSAFPTPGTLRNILSDLSG